MACSKQTSSGKTAYWLGSICVLPILCACRQQGACPSLFPCSPAPLRTTSAAIPAAAPSGGSLNGTLRERAGSIRCRYFLADVQASGFGPLKEGYMVSSSTALARKLLAGPPCAVLTALGKQLEYEVRLRSGSLKVHAHRHKPMLYATLI